MQAPVLVLHARHDHHVPVDFAISAAAGHPSWTIEILEAGGHNLHAERPADWLAAAAPWLDGLSAGPSLASRTSRENGGNGSAGDH